MVHACVAMFPCEFERTCPRQAWAWHPAQGGSGSDSVAVADGCAGPRYLNALSHVVDADDVCSG